MIAELAEEKGRFRPSVCSSFLLFKPVKSNKEMPEPEPDEHEKISVFESSP